MRKDVSSMLGQGPGRAAAMQGVLAKCTAAGAAPRAAAAAAAPQHPHARCPHPQAARACHIHHLCLSLRSKEMGKHLQSAGSVESCIGGCPTVLPNRTPQPTEMPTTCQHHTCSARVLRMMPCRPAPAAKSMAAAAPGQNAGCLQVAQVQVLGRGNPAPGLHGQTWLNRHLFPHAEHRPIAFAIPAHLPRWCGAGRRAHTRRRR